jgi:HK97 family phage portal protein
MAVERKKATSKKRATAPAKKRAVTPSKHRATYLQPDGWFEDWLYGGTKTNHVSERAALAISAYFAAGRNISEDVASLPLKVRRDIKPRGSEEFPDHPVAHIFNRAPNDSREMTAISFRQTILAHALFYKGGFAEIVRNGQGDVAGLYLLDPTSVQLMRNSDTGALEYWVRAYDRFVVLRPVDVFHIHGLGFDGITGYLISKIGRESLHAALSAQRFRGAFFGNGAMLSGVLNTVGKLSDEALERLRETFARRHQGAENAYSVAVLEEGLTWEPASANPQESQLIEAMQFDIEDVCRWFRINPNKVQHWLRTTYNNVEASNTDHSVDTLNPWCVRIEQEINVKLFKPSERGLYAKHCMQARLRGDVAARAAFYRSMFNTGCLSPNDIRELEDLNPIGEEGDEYYVNSATVPLKQIYSGDLGPNRPNPPGDNTINAARSLLRVLIDRAIRWESDQVARAVKRENGTFKKWAEEFYARRKEEIAAIYQPVIALSLPSLSDAMVAEYARAAADAYISRSISSIETGASPETWVDSRPATEIEEVIQLIANGGCHEHA